MRFRIHWEYPDGTTDNIVLQGDTIEDIREKAHHELAKRGLDADSANAWSEEL